MAVEASRSPSGSADSYIGSLISLTSKSEIRYEGLLFNINTHESSIGLTKVRSFGTEGRKKDGRYVPPSNKVYEYILFRGSDIKDLQVKSSPPVQTATPTHNDPAIIQSHYPQAPAASTNLASSGSGYTTDLSSHTAQAAGLPKPTFQGNRPLYQPDGRIGSWGPSPAPPTTNDSGLAMQVYWQGYYGSSNGNGFQAQQQSLLQPPSGFPVPPSLQQTMKYPPNLPVSQLSEAPSPLLPPQSTGSLSMQNSMLPTQYSATDSNWSKGSIPDKTSSQALPDAAPSTSLPFVYPLTSDFDKSSILPTATGMPKAIPSPIMPFRSVPELVPSVSGTSSLISDEVAVPSLVTPDQLSEPGPITVSSNQSPQSAQKDVEVVKVSSSELPPAVVATEAQEPLLPLPSQPDNKKHGVPTHAHQNIRRGRGRGRGRGNGVSRSVARFTEDFDFTAMNEKFNKDEVWGDLGKSNQYQEDGYLLAESDVGSSNNEPKPVYVKDDFFDSLSCDALNRGSRGGRTRFSELMKLDTETFGQFSRNRGGRGGRGPTRGGWSRGGYYGRGGRHSGYGYGGRGRAPPNSRPPN